MFLKLPFSKISLHSIVTSVSYSEEDDILQFLRDYQVVKMQADVTKRILIFQLI